MTSGQLFRDIATRPHDAERFLGTRSPAALKEMGNFTNQGRLSGAFLKGGDGLDHFAARLGNSQLLRLLVVDGNVDLFRKNANGHISYETAKNIYDNNGSLNTEEKEKYGQAVNVIERAMTQKFYTQLFAWKNSGDRKAQNEVRSMLDSVNMLNSVNTQNSPFSEWELEYNRAVNEVGASTSAGSQATVHPGAQSREATRPRLFLPQQGAGSTSPMPEARDSSIQRSREERSRELLARGTRGFSSGLDCDPHHGAVANRDFTVAGSQAFVHQEAQPPARRSPPPPLPNRRRDSPTLIPQPPLARTQESNASSGSSNPTPPPQRPEARVKPQPRNPNR
jgi:hypothetical protein